MNLRAIAIYLPQFHPIPENDAWWGKGFTEWTNVTKAKPLFKGHYQPHLPAHLGFYDLRLTEVRDAQARLAKAHGIYGFCYYHYWFNGKRLLERPFEEVFTSGKPDFPFMLCWANEHWTRAWDGKSGEVLLEQKYSEEDDRNHIYALMDYFKDPRYIRIDNKPVIAIYNSMVLPDVELTIKTWRKEAAAQGMELYICRFESHHTTGKEFLKAGFDAAIDFQPWGGHAADYHATVVQQKKSSFAYKAKYFFSKKILRRLSKELHQHLQENLENETTYHYRFDYAKYVDHVIKSGVLADYKRYPCLMPMWDNSPRRAKRPAIFYNSTPGFYKQWLQHIVCHFKGFSEEENFLFINAWNEWGEGNHLEPCMKWGMQYLEATKEVLYKPARPANRTNSAPKVSVIVPNYNHGRFLRERFDSIFKQTYQNFEVIILDDCSNDDSKAIIEQYKQHEKVSHVVYNETNSGSAFRQWQLGLEYARGEYVWIAESDDWCEENFLAVLVAAMEQNKQCSIAYVQSVCVDENKRIKWQTYHRDKAEFADGKRFSREQMTYRNPIVNASMAVFRKKFADAVPADYTSFNYCGDWLFWTELAQRGDVYISNQTLNYFRKHNDDVTGKALATGFNIIEEAKLIAALFKKKFISRKKYKELLSRCYGKYAHHKEQYKPNEVRNILNAFKEQLKSPWKFQGFILVRHARVKYRSFKSGIASVFS